MKNRYLEAQIRSDLDKKMVFLGGPRQCGKTTLAKKIMGKNLSGYFNWDDNEDRRLLLERKLPNTRLWIFDEIHKYRGWRNYVKGLFDKHRDDRKILVTGSAKLDFYRFGGDSLQGRYHYLRLHPLSCSELSITKQKELDQLFKLGGFPEPFFSGSEKEARRWSREYRTKIVREEMTKLEQVQELDKIELLTMRLPDLVGNPLSINALREDLLTSHKSVSKWLKILERLFHTYRVTPFGSPKIKAVKKEFKHYHFDWSVVKDEGARFENMVGNHLLKWCQFIEDTEGHTMELQYFRDIEGKEVDFVVVKDLTPILFVECKFSDTTVAKPLKYVKAKFPDVRAVQVVWKLKDGFVNQDGVEVVPALGFLNEFV